MKHLLILSFILGFGFTMAARVGATLREGTGGGMVHAGANHRRIAQAGNAVDSIFQRDCANCHGTEGAGNGPAAMALSPRPQDFRDCQRMSQYSDQKLFDAIKGGGQAVGLSPMMPAWGGSLNDEQIHELVQHVRGFCQ